MLFVFYVYFPSVCMYRYYLGSLFHMSCVSAMFPCETSHSDEERLSLQIHFSSVAFKCCPTEEKYVDSNFTHTNLTQRHWTASIDSTSPEETVAVYLFYNTGCHFKPISRFPPVGNKTETS